MPRRFKRSKIKRRRGKKSRRVAKKRGKPTTAIMRGPNGFPDRIRVKLTYYMAFNSTHALGQAQIYQYRGNSVFDPDYSSTGGQPNGFDQWKAFYGKYRVSGSSCRIISVVPGSTAMSGTDAVGVSVVLAPSNVTTITGPQDLAEIVYSKIRSSTYYTPVRELKSYMSTAKMLGVNKKSVEDEDNNSALISANPANQWYWNVMIIPSNTGATYYWFTSVKLTYYTEFYSRLDLGTS